MQCMAPADAMGNMHGNRRSEIAMEIAAPGNPGESLCAQPAAAFRRAARIACLSFRVILVGHESSCIPSALGVAFESCRHLLRAIQEVPPGGGSDERRERALMIE